MTAPSKKVRFITLGCRVNQYETQGMREALGQAGIADANTSQGQVDYVVINTCTVTAQADRENRYWIRRARREHPGASIIVTGCGVGRDRQVYEQMQGVDQVVGNEDKAEIADFLDRGCSTPEVQSIGAASKRHQFTPLSISSSQGHTRAFIKIQDGCNHACSFCKVVLVRGRSRSRELKDIIDEVARLRDAGYRDVSFAGIQLGAYGLDFENKGPHLEDVLEACARIEGIERLRLSSIEPTDVRPSLIKTLASIEKCMPHLHIPLQSGDNHVLERMNRRYQREFYLDLVSRLKQALPDFCLTMDVMAGFPGESEQEHRRTMDLIREVEPLKCHVFPYSRREGTRAARLGGDLPPESIRGRVREMMALSASLGQTVQERYIGRTLPVLIESALPEGEMRQGLSPNFMKINFPAQDTSPGQIVPVEITGWNEGILQGGRAHAEGVKAVSHVSK